MPIAKSCFLHRRMKDASTTSVLLTWLVIRHRLGSVLYQDTGFQGFTCPDVKIIQPQKKLKGRDLTPEEKVKNREISSIRIRVEHAIAGIKRFRIVKDKLRNYKKGFADFVMETCCGLHNFRLNFRPWEYPIPQD